MQHIVNIAVFVKVEIKTLVRVLDRIVANRGYLLKLRMYNGPELLSQVLARWLEYAVILGFITLDKPTQNAFIERFNRT